MTVSELIGELNDILEKYGDLPVSMESDTYMDYKDVTVWTIADIKTGKEIRVLLEPKII